MSVWRVWTMKSVWSRTTTRTSGFQICSSGTHCGRDAERTGWPWSSSRSSTPRVTSGTSWRKLWRNHLSSFFSTNKKKPHKTWNSATSEKLCEMGGQYCMKPHFGVATRRAVSTCMSKYKVPFACSIDGEFGCYDLLADTPEKVCPMMVESCKCPLHISASQRIISYHRMGWKKRTNFIFSAKAQNAQWLHGLG